MAKGSKNKLRRRFGTLAVLGALAASFAVTSFVPAHADETESSNAPRIVGELPARISDTGIGLGGHRPPPMIVDQRHKRGFAMGTEVNGDPIPYHSIVAPSFVVMYDLEHLTVADEISLEYQAPGLVGGDRTWTAMDPSGIETWAIDEERQKIYLAANNTGAGAELGCADTAIVVLDYGGDELSFSMKHFPCSPALAGGAFRLAVQAMTLFSPPAPAAKKLYVSATYYADNQARSVPDGVLKWPGLTDNEGSSLLLMQLDMSGDDPSFDWYIDLKTAGCGRRDFSFVDRSDNDVIGYCHDVRAGNFPYTGQNGYVVRIPLKKGMPVTSDDQAATTDPVTGLTVGAVIRRTPALPGPVAPMLDHTSGNLLLATADSPANGNAVWLFDPRSNASRFVGLISAGYGDQPAGNAGWGFDPIRGRGYLLTVNGLLVAPIRHKPLPAGLVYPVLVNPDVSDKVPFLWKHGKNSPSAGPGRPAPMAVLATLAHPRLFVPVTHGSCPASQVGNTSEEHCPRYVVVDDFTNEPEDPEPDDPDRLTQDLAEEDGKTTSNATGSGAVAAARLLVTGGLSRAVNQKDPNCGTFPHDFSDDSSGGEPGVQRPPGTDPLAEQYNYEGACFADQLISKGNRDVSFSAASVDAGSTTGSTADAGGVVFASSDNADDADLRRAASCGEDNVNSLPPRPPQADDGGDDSDTTTTTSTTTPSDGWRDGCNQVLDGMSDAGLADPRAGTKGVDNSGYPSRAIHCGDFGGTAGSDAQAQGPDDFPRDALSSSNVDCDAATNSSKATSTANDLTIFTGGGVVSVARLFSSIETTKTDDGQVTDALASARGVTIGPLSIGEVRAEAHTRAHGRPGTTSTSYARQWCAVSGDGISIPGCIDPSDPANRAKIDELNDKLGTLRIELTPVKTEATKGGYQALALKDTDAAHADAAVNDDDSFAVPAMQIVFYNDGNEGRNRYIVQLANIRSESHYAIAESPDFAADETQSDDAPPADTVDIPPPPDVAASPEVFDEPVAEAPPQAEYVELADLQRVSDTSEGLSLPAPGRPFAERLLRVPAEIVKNAVRLLVSKPGEFMLLFALWTLLGAPVYLAMRRRSFAQSLID